jgi:hypothetical protein
MQVHGDIEVVVSKGRNSEGNVIVAQSTVNNAYFSPQLEQKRPLLLSTSASFYSSAKFATALTVAVRLHPRRTEYVFV